MNTKHSGRYVAYYRVSTARQGRSGLGLEAQRQAVGEHLTDAGRVFVIFTANFDETGTHGPTPTAILAAFVGHAYQWQRFNVKLSRLQTKYGFKIFHAVEFKAKKGGV